ncbi:hypothetical protein ACP275_05G031600 [Erythranthe tilingii]
MMISYSSPAKLKTKPIIYENVIVASGSFTLEQLKELSAKRKAIEDFINENTFIPEAIAREMSGGLTSRCEQDIQKVESYLPLLENLVRHIDLNQGYPQVKRWISELKIRWCSGLIQPSIFQGTKFYQINDVRFELVMTLFVYGTLLRERALEILPSDLVQSANLFRKAAGVYVYVNELVSIALWTGEMPPEATRTVSSIMSLICVADAQAVTARRGEENSNTGGLLAKLHCGVKEILVEAIGIFQNSTELCKDISPRFLDFMWSCKILHEMLNCKYFVEGLKSDDKVGPAIGYLRWSIANAKKSQPREDSSKLVHKQVIDDLIRLLQKYEYENNFVGQQRVPDNDELPFPEAIRIVSHVPYEPQRWERELVFRL